MDEGRQSQSSYTRTETSYDEKYTRRETQYDEKENDAKYANEIKNNAKYSNEDRFDEKYSNEREAQAKYPNEAEIGEKYAGKNDIFSEEKTFYGVRKGRIDDSGDQNHTSPTPSPRSRSRLSSFSDDGRSGFSSEGTGMHVGWTSDVGVSSGPEYSGITDEESDGEGGRRGTIKGRKEVHEYGQKTEARSGKLWQG